MHVHGPHHPGDLGWVIFQVLAGLVLVAVAGAYAAGVCRAGRRARWPVARTASMGLGLACLGIALVGPLAEAARHSFPAHMTGHLLAGMLGPLLVVLGAPMTVALRALPVGAARRLTRVLRSLPVRTVTHPIVAGALNAGGLWVLYTTDLFVWMHTSMLGHALVHVHMILAGWLFTAALVGPDPDPHRASMRLRSGVLIVFVAAHSILAKWVYAYPPPGVSVEEARTGAQIMYYGGDAVDVTLIVLLFAGWYAATRPRPWVVSRS